MNGASSWRAVRVCGRFYRSAAGSGERHPQRPANPSRETRPLEAAAQAACAAEREQTEAAGVRDADGRRCGRSARPRPRQRAVVGPEAEAGRARNRAVVAGRARTLLTHQNRAPAREQCNRGRVKGPPERGTVILWLPAGRRARQQQSQPRQQLRGRRTAGEPPKRLGNRLVGNADTLGDETVRVAKATKPSGVWRDRAVHRRGLDPTKGELTANASAGANAIVAGPPLLVRLGGCDPHAPSRPTAIDRLDVRIN